MRKIAYTNMFLATFLAQANAAEISTFYEVDTETGKNIVTYISVIGDISYKDEEKFIKILKDEKYVHGVYLLSYGGNAHASLEMAEKILEHKLVTMVPDNGYCHSGCAMMFLMGKYKYQWSSSKITIHSVHEKLKNSDGSLKIGKDGREEIAPVDSATMEFNGRAMYLLGRAGYTYKLAEAWVKTPGNHNFSLTKRLNSDWNLQIKYVE